MTPEQMLRQYLEDSRASRANEDQLAMRLVRAIRSRDMDMVREVLDERLAESDDRATDQSGELDEGTGERPAAAGVAATGDA